MEIKKTAKFEWFWAEKESLKVKLIFTLFKVPLVATCVGCCDSDHYKNL